MLQAGWQVGWCCQGQGSWDTSPDRSIADVDSPCCLAGTNPTDFCALQHPATLAARREALQTGLGASGSKRKQPEGGSSGGGGKPAAKKGMLDSMLGDISSSDEEEDEEEEE